MHVRADGVPPAALVQGDRVESCPCRRGFLCLFLLLHLLFLLFPFFLLPQFTGDTVQVLLCGKDIGGGIRLPSVFLFRRHLTVDDELTHTLYVHRIVPALSLRLLAQGGTLELGLHIRNGHILVVRAKTDGVLILLLSFHRGDCPDDKDDEQPEYADNDYLCLLHVPVVFKISLLLSLL